MLSSAQPPTNNSNNAVINTNRSQCCNATQEVIRLDFPFMNYLDACRLCGVAIGWHPTTALTVPKGGNKAAGAAGDLKKRTISDVLVDEGNIAPLANEMRPLKHYIPKVTLSQNFMSGQDDDLAKRGRKMNFLWAHVIPGDSTNEKVRCRHCGQIIGVTFGKKVRNPFSSYWGSFYNGEINLKYLDREASQALYQGMYSKSFPYWQCGISRDCGCNSPCIR